jgi:hypothetical protein
MQRESMRQKVNADANQDGRRPSAPIHIFFEKEFARDCIGNQGQRSGRRRHQRQVQMIEREQERKECQRQKSHAGKEQRAGDNSADRAFEAALSADLIKVANGLHGRRSEHFAGC